ncbi:MAG: hypothetical protein M0Z79_10305 [Nitrospiraceae bacterium]|nr:hypothetical protein [Nitrospiraceae bacterium]
MGKEEDIKTRALQKIIVDLRMNHADAIDKAYAYFWDEYSPDEFLAGTALELGFINFEDWLVFDWKANEEGETFLDLRLRNRTDLPAEEREVLSRMRDSVLSLYEVASVSKDKRVLVKDILLSDEYSLRNRMLTRGLKKGDIFATRILHLDDGPAMSGCVYPYRREDRKKVLSYIDKQFSRYKRNVRADGTMREYLKDYGDVFNLVWLNFIQNPVKDTQ